MIDIKSLTIKKAREHLTKKDFSATELALAYKKEAEKKNPELNAYLELYSDIEAQAKHADKKISEGKANSLTGIPISVKDNILIKGRTVSSASKILEHYHGTYDATVIEKLKDKDVVFLGRTNMDEFAMGGSTENSGFGVTKNPHDSTRVPGGSSGGAAASVASNMALAALGSDTGGSIRQPAALCGIVGFKGTYGSVSRSGLMAMASSLDQIGPLTKTVEDAEILFNAIRGKDTMDATSIDIQESISEKKKYKIGVPYEFFNQGGIDKDVVEKFNQSLEKLKSAGHDIVEIKLPNIKYALAVYYILMPAEVSSNLARYDGVKYGMLKEGGDLLGDYLETRHAGFGPEARRRIILGTYVLSTGYYDAYYSKANSVRALLTRDFEKAFENVDFVVTPTSPTPAFKIGEKADPVSMYLADIFTVSANLTSLPAISIPAGTVERDGTLLPIGIQFTAPYGSDLTLFDIGKKFEHLHSTK